MEINGSHSRYFSRCWMWSLNTMAFEKLLKNRGAHLKKIPKCRLTFFFHTLTYNFLMFLRLLGDKGRQHYNWKSPFPSPLRMHLHFYFNLVNLFPKFFVQSHRDGYFPKGLKDYFIALCIFLNLNFIIFFLYVKWCVKKPMLVNKPVLSMHCIINYGPTSASLMRGNILTDYEENEIKQISRRQLFPASFFFLTGLW